ncbi:hypothetical protein [Streptomyces sp. NPDC060194]|uniref:hypothetical protein n=1 Tax=Streptomyces sp. NPDC060194 TaxID=3347069 RepID=UPI0036498E15
MTDRLTDKQLTAIEARPSVADVPDLVAEIRALHADRKALERLRAELAARPAEAHVLRQAAFALGDDVPADVEEQLLVMANRAEAKADARPWITRQTS